MTEKGLHRVLLGFLQWRSNAQPSPSKMLTGKVKTNIVSYIDIGIPTVGNETLLEQRKNNIFYFLEECFKSAVPSLCGTRDWSRGRQVSHRPGARGEGDRRWSSGGSAALFLTGCGPGSGDPCFKLRT